MSSSAKSGSSTVSPAVAPADQQIVMEKPAAPVIDVSKLDPNVSQVKSTRGQLVKFHREPQSKQDVKENLAFYRVCAGLSQRNLADKSGFPQPFIANWEAPDRFEVFTWEQAKKLSSILNAPIEHLDPRNKPFSLRDDPGEYRCRNMVIKLVLPPQSLLDLKNNLFFYRMRMGLTQEQLAGLVQVEKTAVARWENKKILMWPKSDKLMLVANALNADIANLDPLTYLEGRDVADSLPQDEDERLRAVEAPRRLNQAKDNLRFYRLCLSLSKDKVAAKLGVPAMSVAAWETSKNHQWMDAATRRALAHVLKCPERAFSPSSEKDRIEVYMPSNSPTSAASAMPAKAAPSLQWALDAINGPVANLKTANKEEPNATGLCRLAPLEPAPDALGGMVDFAQICKLSPDVTYAVLTITDDSLKASTGIAKGDVVVIDTAQNDPHAVAGELMAVALPNEKAMVKFVFADHDDLMFANSHTPYKVYPMPKNSLVLGRVVTSIKAHA
ncbi:MAG: helix-turn-helix domain-containing protein [Candidatus Anaerobiospirillum pullicola]|uniref:Helix-turn-helix domain-containing protein n=1 Tax=Candidatus Anaerobiospirillum pullicola TaxID=2838451 RepID=A0A948TG29_9GAMM|nr:helix-turn-helix domain-containing protein [Candidatus Anaerobiospirillum pullicola]